LAGRGTIDLSTTTLALRFIFLVLAKVDMVVVARISGGGRRRGLGECKTVVADVRTVLVVLLIGVKALTTGALYRVVVVLRTGVEDLTTGALYRVVAVLRAGVEDLTTGELYRVDAVLRTGVEALTTGALYRVVEVLVTGRDTLDALLFPSPDNVIVGWLPPYKEAF